MRSLPFVALSVLCMAHPILAEPLLINYGETVYTYVGCDSSATYSFYGQAGDVLYTLLFEIVDTGGECQGVDGCYFNPTYTLIDPNGQVIKDIPMRPQYEDCCECLHQTYVLETTLQQEGYYQFIVRDLDQPGRGIASLSIQRANDPERVVETLSPGIEYRQYMSLGEMDTYAIDVPSWNAVLSLEVVPESGSVWEPFIRIYPSPAWCVETDRGADCWFGGGLRCAVVVYPIGVGQGFYSIRADFGPNAVANTTWSLVKQLFR